MQKIRRDLKPLSEEREGNTRPIYFHAPVTQANKLMAIQPSVDQLFHGKIKVYG